MARLLLAVLLVAMVSGLNPANVSPAPVRLAAATDLRKVVAVGDLNPFKAGETVRDIGRRYSVNDNDGIAYIVHLGGVIQALWVQQGTVLRQIVRTGQDIPASAGGDGQFGAIVDVDLNNHGDVVFEAGILNSTSGYGIFLHSGGVIQKVARQGEFNLSALLAPRINDAKRVVFNGNSPNGPGPSVYSWESGGLGVAIPAQDWAVGDPHKAIRVGKPSIDAAGTVYAVAEVAGFYEQDAGFAVHHAIMMKRAGEAARRISTASIDTPSRQPNNEYTHPVTNDLGAVIWGGDYITALGLPSTALYISVGGGPPTVLIAAEETVLGAPGVVDMLIPVPQAINADRTIVLESFDGSAIVLYQSGTLSTYVTSGTPTPEGGVFGDVYLPAISNTGCVAFLGEVMGGNTPLALWFCVQERPELDLDVDSDNNDEYEEPARTEAEDRIEDDVTLGAKLVPANGSDKDLNGIPDFADPLVPDDLPNFGGMFVPLVIAVPVDTDIATGTLTFDYPVNRPIIGDVDAVPQSDGSVKYVPRFGNLRIWSQDTAKVDLLRADIKQGGHFIGADTYSLEQLGFTASRRKMVFYLEGIPASQSFARVKATLNPGNGGAPTTDSVQLKIDPCPPPLLRRTMQIQHTKETSPTQWGFTASVSPKDGLTLDSVKLRDRFMAASMSVPYFEFQLAGDLTPRRVELTPEGPDCHLAQIRQGQIGGFPARLVITAVYVVKNLRPNDHACFVVTQRYEFREFNFDDEVEPSRNLPWALRREPGRAARYFPACGYSFHGNAGEVPRRVEIPQRFHFAVDQATPNSSILLRDDDVVLSLDPFLIDVYPINLYRNENPLLTEALTTGIVNGKAGEMDNYHQSTESIMDLPWPRPPGVPEGIHIHWRWGRFLGFPRDRPAGQVITLRNHNLDVGVVALKPDEGHPKENGWRSLVGNDELATQTLIGGPGAHTRIVNLKAHPIFWYAGFVDDTTPAPQKDLNCFFTHGGFYAPVRPPHLKVIPSKKTARVGEQIDFQATIHELVPDHPYEVAWDFGDGQIIDFHAHASDADLQARHAFAAPGTYLVLFAVRDADGFWSSAYEAVTVSDEPSNTPPIANAGIAQTVEQSGLAGASVSLNGTLSSDPDGDALVFAWTGAFGTVFGPSPVVSLPLGATSIILTVTDGRGGTAQASVLITVQDTLPPVLANVPASVVVEQASAAGTVVLLSPPTATDVCDAAPLVTGNVPAVFPPGTTNVTWTALDASGNSMTAVTQVTVADRTAPSIVLIVANPSRFAAAGTGGGGGDPREIRRLEREIAREEAALTRLRLLLARERNRIVRLLLQTFIVAVERELARDRARLDELTGGGEPDQVTVTVSVVASDACDPSPLSLIVSVSSSDGGFVPVGPAPLSVPLEALPTGSPTRTYTITVRTTDAAGNSSDGTVTVTTP